MTEKTDDKAKPVFWTTLPGILTALAAVITAVGGLVVALSSAGVLGSSPATPTPTVSVGAMTLQCTVNPSQINQGQTTQVSMLAIASNNAPVSNANVRLDAPAGSFDVTNNTTVVGTTDTQGVFKVTWRAPKPALSPTYALTVQVSKSGFASANGECNVSVH